MRKFVIASVTALLLAAVYVASPLLTAWNLRRAMHTADADYLASAIAWDSVRETIKPSLVRLALGVPDPADADAAKPGLWQRLKAAAGRSAIEHAVQSYVTPEGFPSLLSMGRTYREGLRGEQEEKPGTPLGERVAQAWSRVLRAEFTGPTRFELAMSDKFAPERVYAGVLELVADGWNSGWKLTELRIQSRDEAAVAAAGRQADTR
jgi:hypothetical protein